MSSENCGVSVLKFFSWCVPYTCFVTFIHFILTSLIMIMHIAQPLPFNLYPLVQFLPLPHKLILQPFCERIPRDFHSGMSS